MKQILKRDGSRQEFLAHKISDAIQKAFASECKNYDVNVFATVMKSIIDKEILSVEDVQDAIEKALFGA